MQIIISNNSEMPVYEQIENGIKELILNGELESGELLPSIRSLAKDLRVSVITTKRAYDELEKSDFIEIIQSKGCFVKNRSKEILKEEILKNIESKINEVICISNKYKIQKEEIIEIFNCLYEEEK